MATAHAPAFLSHSWGNLLDTTLLSTKTEKIVPEDDEYNKWFNADNFQSSSNSSSPTSSALSSPAQPSYTTQQAQQITNALNLVSSSAVYTQPLTINVGSSSSTTSTSSSAVATVPVSNFNSQGFQAQFPFTFGYAGASSQVNGQSPTFNLIQVPIMGASQNANGTNQVIPQMIVLPNFGFSNQQQLTVNPQFYSLMLTQFQSLKSPSSPSSGDEDCSSSSCSEDRKKRGQKTNQRRVRQTRPKVVEAKGAVQCVGRNRKKNAQCRNAALMEYIGPRPVYCAEHIELDPNSLYEKCKSPYQKEVDDKKGCKEVVLKEFGLCYKHYGDTVQEMIRNRDLQTARRHFDRIAELLDQLEREATAAKKKDGDLYQRKNKLIPKFQEMKKIITKGLEELQAKEVDALRAELSAPVMLKLAQNNCAEEPIDASYPLSAPIYAQTADDSPMSDLEARMLDHLS